MSFLRLARWILVLTAGVWVGYLPPAFAEENGKAQKTIDFEGEVVEGVSQQPLDAMNEISEKKDGANRDHLYLRRKDFWDGSDELVNDLLELK